MHKINESEFRKTANDVVSKDNLLSIGFEIIDLESIKNSDFNLVGSWYRKNIKNSKYNDMLLSGICHIYNGSTPLRKNPQYWEKGSVPWFTLEDLENGEIIYNTKQYITLRALKETNVKMLPKDSVLLSCTATIGKVALNKIALTTNQQINGLVIKDKYKGGILSKYLFYACKSLKTHIMQMCTMRNSPTKYTL